MSNLEIGLLSAGFTVVATGLVLLVLWLLSQSIILGIATALLIVGCVVFVLRMPSGRRRKK